jgi:hypothetical protein
VKIVAAPTGQMVSMQLRIDEVAGPAAQTVLRVLLVVLEQKQLLLAQSKQKE